MRAVYHVFDSYDLEQEVSLSGDTAHHLNVVRARIGEKILLLNGLGKIATGEIVSFTKNEVSLKIQKIVQSLRTHELSLAIANPKKDAFEDIMRAAVELGIKEIFPLSSEFSQYDYSPSERMMRVMESALVQSNNPFFPKIHAQQSLLEFLATHQNKICFFNSKLSNQSISGKSDIPKTILIGPEGGFSTSETSAIQSFFSIQEIHLPTPILRAPTAVASAVGYLLAK